MRIMLVKLNESKFGKFLHIFLIKLDLNFQEYEHHSLKNIWFY
jgi:hypothetical protein